MKTRWQIVALSMVGAVACTPGGDRGATPPGRRTAPEPYVGHDTQVDAGVLRFVDETERKRFERARACLAERGKAWTHFPLRRIGNFVEENWCDGDTPTGGCAGGNFREQVGSAWAGVGALHYDASWPEVFGVQIEVGQRSGPERWSVAVSGSSNGHGILGDHGHISLTKTGDEAETLFIGTSYEWAIGESRFHFSVGDDAWTLFDRVRASPEALRDEAMQHWTKLRTQAVAALKADEVLECVYGEYEGRGIPPECIDRVPLPPDKKAAELERIERHVTWIDATLQAESDAMFAALLEAAPTDCF